MAALVLGNVCAFWGGKTETGAWQLSLALFVRKPVAFLENMPSRICFTFIAENVVT